MKSNGYQTILASNEDTVVFEYNPVSKTDKSFQTEAQLEQELIDSLVSQGYHYLSNVKDQESLIANLKTQLEILNNYQFSPFEWKRFYKKHLIDEQDVSPKAKSKMLHQNQHIFNFELDNGKTKNFKIIDKSDIHKNSLQVINQYTNEAGQYKNRYDVTILVNGFPLVQVELKRRGQDLQEAFNQINRYKAQSFFADSGLFEYLQIFVISNGTLTRYYANTTRELHVRNINDKQILNEANSSFSFTNKWADSKNNNIDDLIDFSKTFLSRTTLLNILTKYCVFSADEKLLVLRPYQIVAVERILNQIKIAHNDPQKLGKPEAGGYIWHTTGSGKTLTSFKTTQLIQQLNYIDKVLFVVDRQDLDYQTIKEYEKFQEGSVLSNRSTKILQRQLETVDSDRKVIITTIQKLSNFIKDKKNSKHPVFQKHVVLIFDECHRSQFGEMHKQITKAFKKYNLFGFTGTPIFAANAQGTLGPIKKLAQLDTKQSIPIKTTEQLFGQRLHTYTVINAIKDGNVLKFKIDYQKTFKEKEEIEDYDVADIDRAEVWLNEARINENVKYILTHFKQKTYRSAGHQYHFDVLENAQELAQTRQNQSIPIYRRTKLIGFNSILACSSIEMAKMYYQIFKAYLDQMPAEEQLKIALIYSFNPNDGYNDQNGFLDEENNEDPSALDLPHREFLDKAIADYNQMFATNYDTSSEKFINYYKDVALRMKNKALDLLIVVNMFLTGFDAPTLNTLWVDKWMKMHGLMQAFSRTNRILNKTKTHGNIVTFRPLKLEVDRAISLFSDQDASGLILIKTFEEYYHQGYLDDKDKRHPSYQELVNQLKTTFALESLNSGLDLEIKVQFIKLFGQILKLRSLLLSFDEFLEQDLLNQREIQNYLSYYHDFYEDSKRVEKEKESIVQDLIFEVELVRTYDTSIEHLLEKVAEFKEENVASKEFKTEINLLVDSSSDLRSKKALIEEFLDIVDLANLSRGEIGTIWDQFSDFFNQKAIEEIKDLVEEYKLDYEQTMAFMHDCWQQKEFKDHGEDFANLIPKSFSMFDQAAQFLDERQKIIAALRRCYEKFKF